MPTPKLPDVIKQEQEAARQRAAGRQREIKKSNDPSNIARGSKQVRGYKEATRANWARAGQEASMTAQARAYALAQKLAEKKK